MATSVDLGSVLDRAYEDKTLQDSQGSAVGGSRVSRKATTRCFPSLRHPDRGRTGEQQALRADRSPRRARREALVP
jgi:hypothetical protein